MTEPSIEVQIAAILLAGEVHGGWGHPDSQVLRAMNFAREHHLELVLHDPVRLTWARYKFRPDLGDPWVLIGEGQQPWEGTPLWVPRMGS